MASSEDLPDYIVLAIDYGTTYSAAAFAYAGSPEAMAEITVHKRYATLLSLCLRQILILQQLAWLKWRHI